MRYDRSGHAKDLINRIPAVSWTQWGNVDRYQTLD